MKSTEKKKSTTKAKTTTAEDEEGDETEAHRAWTMTEQTQWSMVQHCAHTKSVGRWAATPENAASTLLGVLSGKPLRRRILTAGLHLEELIVDQLQTKSTRWVHTREGREKGRGRGPERSSMPSSPPPAADQPLSARNGTGSS